MSNHSIIEHRANYHFVKVEEDYLAICSFGEHSPHCKALILAILEHWMNAKRESEQEWIYLTLPEWIEQTYECYARNVLIDCLKELLDSELIKRRDIRRFEQNTYEYTLNIEEIQKRIRALPEKAPKDSRPNLDAWHTLQRQKKAKREEERKAKEAEEPEEEEGGLKINGVVGEKSTALKSKRRVGEKSTALRSEGRLKKNDPPLKSKRNIDTNLDSSLTSLTEIQGDDGAVAPAAPPLSDDDEALLDELERQDAIVRRRREMQDNPIETTLEPVSPLVAPATRIRPARPRRTNEHSSRTVPALSAGSDCDRAGDDRARTEPHMRGAAPALRAALPAPPDAGQQAAKPAATGKRARTVRAVAPTVPADPLADATPEVRAIVAEWLAIFTDGRTATTTMVRHATELAGWHPVPGEIARCRLWMYDTDKKKWYTTNGMHLGDVVREFEKWRSLASVPQRGSSPPTGATLDPEAEKQRLAASHAAAQAKMAALIAKKEAAQKGHNNGQTRGAIRHEETLLVAGRATGGRTLVL